MLNLEKIGNRIIEQRKQLGLTQSELANTLYVTHQAVSKWENGKSIPSIEILYEITKLFNISIDYLLDNSEVLENDYSTLFQQLPRDVVISNYLNSKSLNSNLKNIFYLLNPSERSQIISRIISGTVLIKIEVLWTYLNEQERFYLLSVVLSNKFDYDLSKIYHLLSNEERIICHSQVNNETYNYVLHHNIYIRS